LNVLCERAFFVASATMGNICALMSHTRPGDEVILEADPHTNARTIAEELAQIKGIKINLNTVQTNMIYCDVSQLKI